MKNSVILSSVASVAMLVAGTQAMAADLPTPAPLPSDPVYDAPVYEAPAPYSPARFYIRGDAGVGIFDGQGSDEAAAVGVGIGYQWSNLLRSDITFDYAGEYELNNGDDVDAYIVMANLYGDFDFGSWVTPYLGFGIGYGEVDFQGGVGEDDEGVAYATHAGLALDIGANTDLDLSYSFRTIDISGPDFEDHAIRAGMRFKF